jgi:hypothetical protein
MLGHATSRKITEVALLLCLIGAAVLAVTAMTRRSMHGRVSGGVLLAFGLLLLLVAVHFGASPFRGGGGKP